MRVSRVAKAFVALLCLSALSACALTRSEVAVPVQAGKQPDVGTAVVVLPPVDARKFEAAPTDPSIPSLKNAAQITDPEITSRAIARKRNGYGMAIGDVLLNPPQTAASLIGDAVKAGLRDGGYRVVDATDPAAAAAPRINVRIDDFWTWTSKQLNTRVRLAIDGNLPALTPPATVEVHETATSVIITDSARVTFIDSVLAKVRDKVRALVAPKTAALP